MNFQRCFLQNNIVGYSRRDTTDLAFVFSQATAPDLPEEIDAGSLLQAWNNAAVVGGGRQRALYFFPALAGTFPNNAKTFITAALNEAEWDRVTYWNEQVAASGTRRFPNPDSTIQIQIQQLKLALVDADVTQSVGSLSDLDLDLQGSNLVFKARAGKWVIYTEKPERPLSEGGYLSIDLEHPVLKDGEMSNSGQFALPVIASRARELPLRLTFRKINSDGELFFNCNRVLDGSLVLSLHPSKPHAFLALDPRDAAGDTFQRRRSLSRVEFAAEEEFVSSFMTETGQCIRLIVKQQPERGVGHLNFDVLSGTTDPEGWLFDPGDALFSPHGDFILAGVEGRSGMAMGEKVRIVTGSSATEFLEVQIGDVLRFTSGLSSVLRVDDDPAPPAAAPSPAEGRDNILDRFHNGQGFITTSWLSMVREVDFHTQPERSPLFEKPKGGAAPAADASVPLQRKEVVWGTMASTPIPFFPYAGMTMPNEAPQNLADDVTRETRATPDFEHLLLAPARQLLVSRKINPPGPAEDGAKFEYAVTPQGILAKMQLNGNGDFSELYFGDPSGKEGSTQPEFKLKLQAGVQSTAYDDIQRALKSKDLFMVISKLEATATGVIQAECSLDNENHSMVDIRGFPLKLDVGLGGAVLILKFFKDRSLGELLSTESMWACKEHLAKVSTWKEGVPADANNLRNLIYVTRPGGKEMIPQPLERVWKDKDWQGIVVLNLGLTNHSMPDLFEALRPAMDMKALCMHHLGLNCMPVRSTEVAAPSAARPGSAFGLLHYYPKSNSVPPAAPSAGDTHPDPNYKPNTGYDFKVKTLELEFQNSQVARFKCEVEASFSHLFWDAVEPEAGGDKRKLLLEGSYESRKKTDGTTQDVFTLASETDIKIKFRNSWLDHFLIQRAEFEATSLKDDDGTVQSFLGFNGELVFGEGASFPLFKVKKIMVKRLGLRFTYVKKSGSFSCKFSADSIRADVDFGELQDSLLSVLGLKFNGFRLALDEMLNFGKLGFQNLGLGTGVNFHFALDFELDLGFLGKLAGGKGLKLPMLVGWRAGGFDLSHLGLGISFPNWDGTSFEIGLQSFLSLKADKATLKKCPDGGDEVDAFAIVLSKARLVCLGKEWPKDAEINLALFVPAKKSRRMAWAFSIGNAINNDSLKLTYLAAGHRIKAPGGNSTKEVVENFKRVLSQQVGPCTLVDASSTTDFNTDNWVFAGEFTISQLVNVWFAISDRDPTLYGLRLELLKTGFYADAMYRQLSTNVGVFSAEVSLPDSLRTWQVGIATLRLPKIGVEVFTDGGFKLDFGYPWNNDFSRSFQLEIAIFLGSGGFWFGYTSGVGAPWMALDKNVTDDQGRQFQPPHADWLDSYQAISAGIAMRAGIGRSFELGILRGEASLTVFSTLEGGIAYLKKGGSKKPIFYAVRGTMGIMLRIWVEVNFIVLRATAEFSAYALVGFELRRVLAMHNTNEQWALTMPIKVFAEVGIYVHVEVWVTIGCVKVKLFDLEFRGTWHWEETLGGYSGDPLSGGSNPFGIMEAELVEDSSFTWAQNYQCPLEDSSLVLFATLLPCVVQPEDIGAAPGTDYPPAAVMQLMLRTLPAAEGQMSDFEKLCRFMLGWVLESGGVDEQKITREKIRVLRENLKHGTHWNTLLEQLAGDCANSPLLKQFNVSIQAVHDQLSDMAAVPWWPGVRWRFLADPSGAAQAQGDVLPQKLEHNTKTYDADVCLLTDHLRALTGTLLSETERILTVEEKNNLTFTGMTQDELWVKLLQTL